MLSCPYEVPLYNKRQGIVRKCDMCSGRLSAGEAPACVQACPNGAIAIKMVDVANAVAAATAGAVVPGAPPSAITVPTTVYRTAKGLPASIRPASTGPARSHPPLAVMLVLTQLSVGAFVTDLLLRTFEGGGSAGPFDAAVAAAAGVLALGASVFHLGRPRYFYRAVIGFRHSWLSREVVAFGAFTALAVFDALLLWLGAFGDTVAVVVGGAASLAGLAGVACSVLIYTSTRRSSWGPGTVASKFGLTAAASGVAMWLWASVVAATSVPVLLLALLAALMALKLAMESAEADGPRPSRVAAGLVGGVAVPLLLAVMATPSAWVAVPLATVMLGGVVAGELLERLQFFTAAGPPR
jgi:DMSO reductase anchor subunit